MANRVHRPLKVIAFNANGIGRQRRSVNSCKTYIYPCGSLLRDTFKTSWEVLYSKLPLLPNRSPPGKKRWNCRCSEKRYSPHACRPTSPPFSRSNGSAYLLVKEKYCLQQFTDLLGGPGLLQTSLSSWALEINAFWLVIWIPNTRHGIV
jgi:hypothetical protein